MLMVLKQRAMSDFDGDTGTDTGVGRMKILIGNI